MGKRSFLFFLWLSVTLFLVFMAYTLTGHNQLSLAPVVTAIPQVRQALQPAVILSPTEAPFVPPTVAAPAQAPAKPVVSVKEVNVLAEPTRAQPKPACISNLTYQADLTIPDGTVVIPGQQVDKRWQVLNSGTCNWNERYRLKQVAGPDMGAPAEQALYPARSGSQALIRMLLTAPQDSGTYRSAWQAYDPDGNTFGDTIFIDIVVAAPTQAP